MLSCGLIENEEASIAHFRGGLNRDISDILEYREYKSMTCLFHLGMLAKRDVRGWSRQRANFSTGHTSSWTPREPAAPSTHTAMIAPPTSRATSTLALTKPSGPAPAHSSMSLATSTG